MWHRIMVIADWFGEMRERYNLIRQFNQSAKQTFIKGEAPTLLEAKITKGDSEFRHEFSKFRSGGFRIKALSGSPLKKSEMMEIGKIIIDNEELTRKLIALGWDTLEVHAEGGTKGLKWALKKHAKFGGYLN